MNNHSWWDIKPHSINYYAQRVIPEITILLSTDVSFQVDAIIDKIEHAIYMDVGRRILLRRWR